MSSMDLTSSPPLRTVEPGPPAQLSTSFERTHIALKASDSSPERQASIFRNFDPQTKPNFVITLPVRTIKGLPGSKRVSPVIKAEAEHDLALAKADIPPQSAPEPVNTKKERSYDDVLRIGGQWRDREAIIEALQCVAAKAMPPFELKKRGGRSDEFRFTLGCTGSPTRMSCNFRVKVEEFSIDNDKERWSVIEINDVHSDDCLFMAGSADMLDKPNRERRALSSKRANTATAVRTGEQEGKNLPSSKPRRKRSIRSMTTEDEDTQPVEREYHTRGASPLKRIKDDTRHNKQDEKLQGLIALLRLNAGDDVDTGMLPPLAEHMLNRGLSAVLINTEGMSKQELSMIVMPDCVSLLRTAAELAVNTLSVKLCLPNKPCTPSEEDAQDWLGASEEYKSLVVFLVGIHPALANARIAECLEMVGITHETLRDSISKKLGRKVKQQMDDLANGDTNETERVLLGSRLSAWCKAMRKLGADKGLQT